MEFLHKKNPTSDNYKKNYIQSSLKSHTQTTTANTHTYLSCTKNTHHSYLASTLITLSLLSILALISTLCMFFSTCA